MEGNCPLCQQNLKGLSIAPVLNHQDEQLIDSLPYVIAYPLKRTLLEKNAWTKINLLKDSFLNYLKYLGLITASEFFNSGLRDRKMVALFQKTLTETSFGNWNEYIRETLKYLKENEHPFFYAELQAHYEKVETGKNRKLYKGEIEYIDANGDLYYIKQEATAIGMLINFRNRYLGHGLTWDEGKSQELWEEYYPIFRVLLDQLTFSRDYSMLKKEHGEIYSLHSSEIKPFESAYSFNGVWIQDKNGAVMPILPFYIVPAEISIEKDSKEKILVYESYTGKTIKFFSPEGTEKHTSGKILDKLNLILREKERENPYSPDEFTVEKFKQRLLEENKLMLDTLIAEKKIFPGVYIHRNDIEIKLREWTGARSSVFFIAAEAGSGKTNLLIEIQKQYLEFGFDSLYVRAARMEKKALKAELSYLLNIETDKGLEDYPALQFTQSKPFIILLDGLNEALNAEEIWKEIPEICNKLSPGSIKFVITSRAGTKADLERFELNSKDESLIYGEKKENEEGLQAYVFWLRAMDMEETKKAWQAYAAMDKSHYKPLFSFDDIATLDRAVYNQISNPLVLRIFLEVYNGKNLKKKKEKRVNIWYNWLKSMTDGEQELLELLAQEIWETGVNELLLDDLLKKEHIKNFLESDLVNSPYQRLKNMGWIGRYTKDLNACISFTVEGALFYFIGKMLQQKVENIDTVYVKKLIKEGSRLQRSGLEEFLCEEALSGDLSLICALIDEGAECIDICIRPLLYSLKTLGIDETLKKILENKTENDWKALLKLKELLGKLQLQILRKEFFMKLVEYLDYENLDEIKLGLKAIAILDDEVAKLQFQRIDVSLVLKSERADLLSALADCEHRFSNYDKALEYYLKCLDIRLKTLGAEHPSVAISYGDIGRIWDSKGEYDKALEYYEKSLDFKLKTIGENHPNVLNSYNYVGIIWKSKGNYDKALEYFKKSLEISLKTIGENHYKVSLSYNNIGVIWKSKGNYDKALEYFKKSLEISLKTIGEIHSDVAGSYNNIGIIWKSKGNYDKALEYYEKSLEIRLKTIGDKHPDVATNYNNIGIIWKSKGNYDKALKYYEKSLEIMIETLGNNHPKVGISYHNIGSVWQSKGEYDKALEYYEKSLEIMIETLGNNHPKVGISYHNIGSVWKSKGDYENALEYYEKSLEIDLKTIGKNHPDVAKSYYNIGVVCRSKGNYDNAIEFFKKGYQLDTTAGGFPFNIAICLESLGRKDESMNYFIESAEIRKQWIGLENEATIDAIQNAKRLAIELGKENELPDWMRELK
jgi:tetratricopeptide (TPR) repeat protein